MRMSNPTWLCRNRLRGVLAAAELLLVLLLVWRADAQEPPVQPNAPQQTLHQRAKSTVDEQVKRFAAAFDLSESQQIALKTILDQRQQESWRIRHDPAIPAASRNDLLRELQDSTRQRIRSILTDEQRKKYDPLNGQPPQTSSPPNVEDWMQPRSPH